MAPISLPSVAVASANWLLLPIEKEVARIVVFGHSKGIIRVKGYSEKKNWKKVFILYRKTLRRSKGLQQDKYTYPLLLKCCLKFSNKFLKIVKKQKQTICYGIEMIMVTSKGMYIVRPHVIPHPRGLDSSARNGITTMPFSVCICLWKVNLKTGAVTKDNKNIFYYNNGEVPNITAYVKLLEELRSRLASGNDVHGFPVTRPPIIPVQERFVQVQLNGRGDNIVTMIINTTNVYVVGYTNDTCHPTIYYFKDVPVEELRQAFPSYNHSDLNFTGNYRILGERDKQVLGHRALNDAIEELYKRDPKPDPAKPDAAKSDPRKGALLVIIQMVAEAVRIKYIENLIQRNMKKYQDFIPDDKVISLENNWSSLSTQVQLSGESGNFPNPIEIKSPLNESVEISSVKDVKKQAALALMLYHRRNREAIRMPVPVGVAVGDDGQCPYGEPTTNIIGRDGQCVDVKDGDYNNGNPIILSPCGDAQGNQLWTFKSDGTIRSNGKCLTTSGHASGNNIMIFDCDTADPEATKWILYNAGTIMNPRSGLVIAAEDSTPGTVLMLAVDNNSSRQAWSSGNYTEPTIKYISGLHEMCLQANGSSAGVHADSTIRLYSDITLCVTSDVHEIVDSIILLKYCEGSGDQRWTFMADGTILNPKARLVMDVRESDQSKPINPTGLVLTRYSDPPTRKSDPEIHPIMLSL
ncbi:hypothetical protein OSB04_010298 [Centaurea solstitialis]|uniref:Ribosome-inactivating protein n=1 Tax=Centaurea solstitialis TaxID=347529 RepID=A0AA38T8Y8_9ASTR|nr:hypothetical protein OSB04_010298 [Centaurea solstitialis]